MKIVCLFEELNRLEIFKIFFTNETGMKHLNTSIFYFSFSFHDFPSWFIAISAVAVLYFMLPILPAHRNRKLQNNKNIVKAFRIRILSCAEYVALKLKFCSGHCI